MIKVKETQAALERIANAHKTIAESMREAQFLRAAADADEDVALLRALHAALGQARIGFWYPGEYETMTRTRFSRDDVRVLLLPLDPENAKPAAPNPPPRGHEQGGGTLL